MCIEGARSLVDFAEKRNVPFRYVLCGMVLDIHTKTVYLSSLSFFLFPWVPAATYLISVYNYPFIYLHSRTGKLVVSPIDLASKQDTSSSSSSVATHTLERLHGIAHEVGVYTELLTPSQVKTKEPLVAPSRGLYVPSTGIISPTGYVAALVGEIDRLSSSTTTTTTTSSSSPSPSYNGNNCIYSGWRVVRSFYFLFFIIVYFPLL